MAQIKEELLNAVKEARNTMAAIQSELGSIALVELRKEALLEEYKKQQGALNEATNNIREEYGDGEVDLESGEFTATVEEVE